ncbi:MAG TPA: flagellar basal body rod protein FlgB [Thermodesulfovibrionales bacterium]|nr:flagellar basal body rod protein FlgB [Thermodesulfovibrionales bacterium]
MDSFKTLEQLIHFTGMRHGVLTSNIANADTPNYKAKDMNFTQALDAELDLKTTGPGHIGNSVEGSQGQISAEASASWEDGNNVEVDMEVAKMTENAMLFQTAVSLLETKIRMFKTALRR